MREAIKFLPGTGRGTSRRLVEGALHQLASWFVARWSRAPSTTPLRVAVPLPVNGEDFK